MFSNVKVPVPVKLILEPVLLKLVEAPAKVEIGPPFTKVKVLFALKILASLGYIGDNSMHESFVKVPFHDIDYGKVSNERKSIISFINFALKESHL